MYICSSRRDRIFHIWSSKFSWYYQRFWDHSWPGWLDQEYEYTFTLIKKGKFSIYNKLSFSTNDILLDISDRIYRNSF